MRRLISLVPIALVTACTTTPPPRSMAPIEVQVIGLNDFHGNLEEPKGTIDLTRPDGTVQKVALGGAAHLAAALKQARAGRAHSVTVAAGDLIGASPLTSAYFLDEPTILAMNSIGLDLNAVGNHEFDKGSAELLRMQAGGCEKNTTREPCRVDKDFGGARFKFLAANVLKSDGTTLFPGTAVRDFGTVRLGFIGMTLKETATLVTPAGVAGLRFAEEVVTANAAIPALKAAGADAVVLMIHQGGRTTATYNETGCAGLSSAILPILDGLDPAIRLVVSGHTHFAYACERPAPDGSRRLLTSAGKNGYLFSDIRLTFDAAGERLIDMAARNVPVTRTAAPDGEVEAIVDRYAAAAAPAAARVVGRLSGPAPRHIDDGESPAANLIADAQLAATKAADRGGADIGFINATGVRTDLLPAADGSVTYGQIFALQPFGNNLVVKTLTGTQLKALLEQQFETDDLGKPKLGVLLVPSSNFRFAYDLGRPEGQRIRDMWLEGKPIRASGDYRVVVNNFLASGGDGFTVLTEGTDTFDAGLDLDALEAWLATGPSVPKTGRVIGVGTAAVGK